jgi:hypothetical protein
MELHAVEGPSFVADAHDFFFSGPGGDDEIFRQGAGADDEAMVAGGFEGVGESGEDAFAIVEDRGGFAMHEAPVTFHDTAEGVADALVAQANAEGGDLGSEGLEDFITEAGFARAAGAGGNDDVGGFEGGYFGDAGFIVAENFHALVGHQLAEALDEVVGKGVVIIDQNKHGGIIAAVSRNPTFCGWSGLSPEMWATGGFASVFCFALGNFNRCATLA